MRTAQRSLMWIVLAGLFVALATSVQAADCKVGIKSEARGEEDRVDTVIYTYLIEPELKSNIECARLEYDLVIVERLTDGTEETKRIRRTMKLKRGEAKARKVQYRAPKSSKIVSWKYETYRCSPCGT